MPRQSNKLAEVIDVSGSTSIQEVLTKSVTDWDVETHDAGTSAWDSAGAQVIVRPDIAVALAYVGERWRGNRHRDSLAKLDGMVGQGILQPQSVSVWDNGAVLAYQFRCPQLDVSINGKDMVSPFLTLCFSYGVPIADSAFFADFRWFCKNQLGKVAALNGGSRVRHRGNIEARYADILQGRLEEIGGELSGHYDHMRRMVETPLSDRRDVFGFFGRSLGCTPAEIDKAFGEGLHKVSGNPARIGDIIDCYRIDDCGAPGSVWQAYNAVTRYETHQAGRTEANRMRRVLLGEGGTVNKRAWQEAVRMLARSSSGQLPPASMAPASMVG